eukprot:946342-Rhodomonas_salina.1
MQTYTINNLFSTPDFNVENLGASFIIWDKEWRTRKDQEITARKAKKAKQTAAENQGQAPQHIEEQTIENLEI